MADFADKLTELMSKQGESQSSLARKCGIPQTLISAYLRRLNQPSWANVQLIAKAMGVKCYHLEDDDLKLAPPADTPPAIEKPKKAAAKKKVK